MPNSKSTLVVPERSQFFKRLDEAGQGGSPLDGLGDVDAAEMAMWLREKTDIVRIHLHLVDCTFNADLDLGDATVPFGLIFEKCRFQSVVVRGAKVKRLTFLSCDIEGNLDGSEIVIEHSLTLSARNEEAATTLKGKLMLYRAQIGGSVVLDHFLATRKVSECSSRRDLTLDFESAEIGECLYMREPFSCEGPISLQSALVKASLTAEGAKFLHKGQACLFATRLTVEHNVYFSAGFESHGPVDLNGAKIGGQWNCGGGKFLHAGDQSLTAQGIEVSGSVFFSTGFEAHGQVYLNSAKIGDQWNCEGGRFLHPADNCLWAQGIEVKENVFLDDGFEALGEINLNGAWLHSNLRIVNSKLEDIRLDLCRVEGKFAFSPIHLGGVLDLNHAWLSKFEDQFVFSNRNNSRECAAMYRLFDVRIDIFDEEMGRDPRKFAEWIRYSDDMKFNSNLYSQVAKYFIQQGFDAEARKLRILQRRHRREDGNMPGWKRTIEWIFLDVFIGYGYKPIRALGIAAMAIVAGSALFYYAAEKSLIVPTEKAAYEVAFNNYIARPSQKKPLYQYERPGYVAFNPIYYAIEATIPLVDLGQRRNWSPNQRDEMRALQMLPWPSASAFLQFAQFMLGALGWLLTSLFVGGVTGLVKKE